MDGSGSKYSVYLVYKPTSSSDKVTLWSESSTGTGLSLGASMTTVTGTGGMRVLSKTGALSSAQFSLDALVVNGSTMSSFLNGKANGVQTGVTAVSTSNAGTFQVNGTGNLELAEVVVYGGAHTAGQVTMNQINTYLGLKYGITLSHHYYSTVGDTLFYVDGAGTTYLYDNNIAGIGIDSNEVLVQKQGVSQNTSAKGNMLSIAMGTLAGSNMQNAAVPGAGVSYMVWGDDAGSVSATQNTDLPGTVSSCAYRLGREWKMNRTGSGIGTTQVQFDLNNTIPLSAYTNADFQLLIDQDGDGDFNTGLPSIINAASFSGGLVTFNNVKWDMDANGTDVFTLLLNNKIAPVTLLPNGSTQSTAQFSCPDLAGTLIFGDDPVNPTAKYYSVNPAGNTGYAFTGTALNNSTPINNQRRTNGSSATSALSNRLYVINDAGNNTYPSGMKIRLYYDPLDSASAVANLDPAVTGVLYYKWFKLATATPADVLSAQSAQAITNAVWITPAAYGRENGINYVEFSGINTFGTFGSIAIRSNAALPLQLISFTGRDSSCHATLRWQTDQEQNLNHFDVLTSADGLHYLPVAKQPATNHVSGGAYHWSSPGVVGKGYFRLRMVDNDGAFVLSPVVLIAGSCAANGWTVNPNPVASAGRLTVLFTRPLPPTQIDIHLCNLQGQVVMIRQLQGNAGGQSFYLDVAGLATGSYLLSLRYKGDNSYGGVQKIIIQ